MRAYIGDLSRGGVEGVSSIKRFYITLKHGVHWSYVNPCNSV